MKDYAASVNVTGANVTTTISTSSPGTLPLDSAGNPPRYIRFAATGTCYVRIRKGATTALATDAMVTAGAPLTLRVGSCTHYAVIDDGTSVKVNLTPLEEN